MYQLNQATVEVEGVPHITYGVSCSTACVYDVSPDREKVVRLIALCNRLTLSPVHLLEVIDNFLAIDDPFFFCST